MIKLNIWEFRKTCEYVGKNGSKTNKYVFFDMY